MCDVRYYSDGLVLTTLQLRKRRLLETIECTVKVIKSGSNSRIYHFYCRRGVQETLDFPDAIELVVDVATHFVDMGLQTACSVK